MKHNIKNIKELLGLENLTIPDYQRPYKWQTKQVEQLLNDIEEHRKKEVSRYRIGTVVIHNDNENLNIVDGQQRITTLALIFHCLKNEFKITNDNEFDTLQNLKYNHQISQYNIIQNYNFIISFIDNLEDKASFQKFILEKCEVVYIELSDIDEAFQFFDSQNTRGKSLEAYDLLKAFHLREMAQEKRNALYEDEKRHLIAQWAKTDNLKKTFDDLYAIRQWLQNKNTYKKNSWTFDFVKEDVDHFKGICIEKFDYPYLHKIQSPEYLFEIDRPIFNGTLFFKYIIHYSEQIQQLENRIKGEESLKIQLSDIIRGDKTLSDILQSYETRHIFFTMLYRRVLLFYYDKFGEYSFKDALKQSAQWAGQLLKENGLFMVL